MRWVTFPHIELRDGVAIDPKTRTAAAHKKFDMELLQAGTTFDLRFELLVSAAADENLIPALALALHGLEAGYIHLGARKKRGMGECTAGNWRVDEYDLTTKDGLMRWLAQDDTDGTPGTAIVPLLDALIDGTIDDVTDRRAHFRLEAAFWLDSSLLIRAGLGAIDAGADAEHLHRQRDRDEGTYSHSAGHEFGWRHSAPRTTHCPNAEH